MGAIWSAKCVSPARLDGKVALITGCNTGIGKECTMDFYLRGAKVIMACRNMDKANEALADIKQQCEMRDNLGSMQTIQLDLSNLSSVRECAAKLNESEKKIDILLNNAGVMMCPKSQTEDGFEMQFGTNHLGHFLLTLLLLPKIIASDSQPARIVNVASMAHWQIFGGSMNFDDLNWEKRRYHPIAAYAQSKLANILFSAELSRRLRGAGIQHVHTYSLHPGAINTELGRHLNKSIVPGATAVIRFIASTAWKTPIQGAQTSIHCSVSEDAGKETGLYYQECKPTCCSSKGRNEEDAKRLWEESLKLTGLDLSYNPFNKVEFL